MAALTTGRNTLRRDGTSYSFPVAASVTCYGGGLAVKDASGNARPGYVATGLIPLGRFAETVTNGAVAGAVNVLIEPGIFRFDNYASDLVTRADIGNDCYIYDDATVAKTSATSTRSVAGKVVDVDAVGVWVRVGIGA